MAKLTNIFESQESVVAAIKKGVSAKEWNEQYTQKKDKLRLSNVDLSQAKLSGFDLSHCELENVVLDGADLRKANLSNGRLIDVKLTSANLDAVTIKGQAYFFKSHFIEASLKKAVFEQTVLHVCAFYQANLEGASFSQTIFKDCFLGETQFTKCVFDHSHFMDHCILRDTSFSQARHNRTVFWECDCSNIFLDYTEHLQTIIDTCNMKGAILVGSAWNYPLIVKTNFEEANLNDIRVAGARVAESNFINANLQDAQLESSTFEGPDLSGAQFVNTKGRFLDLKKGNFTNVNFTDAQMEDTDFSYGAFQGAILAKAQFTNCDFTNADLSGVDLHGANLSRSNLVDANLDGANLEGCRIFGISAWNVALKNANQNSLITTRENEPVVTVDDLEVAQFIYLMLNNTKIKNVIDTVTSKSVLILGRFTEERKQVLDAMREELRRRNYLPIIFDFDRPASRDLTETITLLARMARFIIADLSDPKSLPQELTSIIPELPSVPVQSIILSSQKEYSMYEHWRRYPWVLEIHSYKSLHTLLKQLSDKVISPPETWLMQQTKNKH